MAHECILDLRQLKESSGGAQGISAGGWPKRLMDGGFHAPTLGFPGPGTLMVEPTEDRDAFRAGPLHRRDDRHPREIRQVERGPWPQDNNR